MKEFFKQNKKLVFGAITVFGVLILLFISALTITMVKHKRYARQLVTDEIYENKLAGWSNDSIRELYKEKWWFEQQLALAKTDSFSLGINLKDSSVQVQLKGTVLFQAKILKQIPDHFFTTTNEKVYQMLFGEISRIDQNNANTPKKPIKKVVAPKAGGEIQQSKKDTIVDSNLYWHFLTNKGIEVIVNGVSENKDSTGYAIPVLSNIWSYRFGEGLNNPFQPVNSVPLFLWLDDQDAKAVYRALPEKVQVIFMN